MPAIKRPLPGANKNKTRRDMPRNATLGVEIEQAAAPLLLRQPGKLLALGKLLRVVLGKGRLHRTNGLDRRDRGIFGPALDHRSGGKIAHGPEASNANRAGGREIGLHADIHVSEFSRDTDGCKTPCGMRTATR